MKNYGWFLLLISLISNSVVSAKTILKVSRQNFSENFTENVKVSGSVLASSFVSGSLSHASSEQLHVFVPSYKPVINFFIVSIDGKYSADAVVNLEPEQIGWIQLKLPTDYQTQYGKYLPNQLVAFAFADSEDMFGDYIQEVFPTSWGNPVKSSLRFFINSAGQSPNVTFTDKSGNLLTQDCVKIEAEYTRVFNHICDVGAYSLPLSSIFTFTPNKKDSGKNYIIWQVNE